MFENFLPRTNGEGFSRFERRHPTFQWSLLIFWLVLAGFVSCVGVSPPPNGLVSRIIPNVPFYPQEEFRCGPASLAEILNYWNVNISPEEIASEIYSQSARGTLNIDMVLYAEKRGLRAKQYRGSLEDIRDRIDSGYPLIVLVDEGFLLYQRNHFMVVIGYGKGGIIAHSGREPSKFIPFGDFLRSWKRTGFWTLLITRK
ncbi:MAG: C39 family peptidase [Thermodesulfobacteriota bacterium]